MQPEISVSNSHAETDTNLKQIGAQFLITAKQCLNQSEKTFHT